MKKFTTLLTVILAANLLFAQYNTIDTSFYSEALQETKMVDVYLPPGYDENPNMHYSVIYYLHGWTENQNDISEMLYWTQTYINDSLIEPVIMVCADNSPEPFMGSMYTNSTIWGNYEDYMTTDLIAWIETTYRCIPTREHRAVFGHSMGGYGAWRLGILHQEKFNVLVASASPYIAITDSSLSYTRTKILQQNQPGPPYFYDFYNSGSTTQFMFLACGAFAPNLNSPQNYINPQILEFPLDENGDYIDTIGDKIRINSVDHLIRQISPTDSLGILFSCGAADISFIEPHEAFIDTIDMLGLPYEYYEHTGGHVMPSGLKKRALIFIDSLLYSPTNIDNIEIHEADILKSFNCFPNPVKNQLFISFEIDRSDVVEADLLDFTGKQIYRLIDTHKPSGKHQIRWNASELYQGMYILRLQIGDEIVTKKIVKL